MIKDIRLQPTQKEAFNNMLKVGILKQLHAEKMLTDMQLNSLISKIEAQNTCTSLEAVV